MMMMMKKGFVSRKSREVWNDPHTEKEEKQWTMFLFFLLINF